MQSLSERKLILFEQSWFHATALIFFQVISYVIVHDGVNQLIKPFWSASKTDIGWGLVIYFSVYSFAALAVITTVLIFTIFKKQIFVVPFASLLIFVALFFRHFGDRPNRTLLLIISAACGFFVPILLMRNQIEEI
jgi:hypothetical protein